MKSKIEKRREAEAVVRKTLAALEKIQTTLAYGMADCHVIGYDPHPSVITAYEEAWKTWELLSKATRVQA